MYSKDPEANIDLREILTGEESVSVTRLYELSDLSPENLDVFHDIWPNLEEERRRIIIRHLADITEENFSVDYSDIFAFGLKDPSSPVRIASLDGLWDSDNVSLIGPILELSRTDPDLEVRRLAVATLGHFVLLGEWKQIPMKYTEPIVEVLLSILTDEASDEGIKRAALESISSSPHPEVAGMIEEAYDSADTKMQISAIFAMGQSADPRWLPIILDETQSHLVEMRIEAARAAGSIGATRAISDLAELTTDEDLEVCIAAVTAIGEIGSDVGREILMDMLEDPQEAELHALIEETLDQMDWMNFDFDIDQLDWDNTEDNQSKLRS